MPPAPALLTAVRALSTDGETAFRAQIAHPLEKSLRPTNGLLAPGELPAGIMGATTVSALLSGISGSTQVPFDGHLRELCDDLAARFGRSGGPRLTCEAADEALPMNATTLFALIAGGARHRRLRPWIPAGARRPDRRVLHGRAGGLAAHRRR